MTTDLATGTYRDMSRTCPPATTLQPGTFFHVPPSRGAGNVPGSCPGPTLPSVAGFEAKKGVGYNGPWAMRPTPSGVTEHRFQDIPDLLLLRVWPRDNEYIRIKAYIFVKGPQAAKRTFDLVWFSRESRLAKGRECKLAEVNAPYIIDAVYRVMEVGHDA